MSEPLSKTAAQPLYQRLTARGDHRISDAIHNALHSPLLKAHDIYTSKRLLFKFTCSRESANALRSEEIAEITQFTSKLPSSIDVKWGIGDNPEMGDRVKITVLASGFDVTLREGNDPKEKDKEKIVFENNARKEEEKQKHEESAERIAEVYGSDKVIKQRRNTARMKYAVLTPSQLDDHEVIAMIESVPTYNREPRFNDELKKYRKAALHSGIKASKSPSRMATPYLSATFPESLAFLKHHTKINNLKPDT